MTQSQAERIAQIEALTHEVGALFDRCKLKPDVASAVLLDCAARILSMEDELARPILLQEGLVLLVKLTEMYARRPPSEMPRM